MYGEEFGKRRRYNKGRACFASAVSMACMPTSAGDSVPLAMSLLVYTGESLSPPVTFCFFAGGVLLTGFGSFLVLVFGPRLLPPSGSSEVSSSSLESLYWDPSPSLPAPESLPLPESHGGEDAWRFSLRRRAASTSASFFCLVFRSRAFFFSGVGRGSLSSLPRYAPCEAWLLPLRGHRFLRLLALFYFWTWTLSSSSGLLPPLPSGPRRSRPPRLPSGPARVGAIGQACRRWRRPSSETPAGPPLLVDPRPVFPVGGRFWAVAGMIARRLDLCGGG